jgi:hypothetical protein
LRETKKINVFGHKENACVPEREKKYKKTLVAVENRSDDAVLNPTMVGSHLNYILRLLSFPIFSNVILYLFIYIVYIIIYLIFPFFCYLFIYRSILFWRCDSLSSGHKRWQSPAGFLGFFLLLTWLGFA